MLSRRSWIRIAHACFLLFALQACQGSKPAAEPKEDKLVVFAAASLRDVFTSMGEAFKGTHAGVELVFNFAGTQELRTQVEHGAAVDVFASADQRLMDELVSAGHVQTPVIFTRNEPVIVVAKSAPAIQSINDLPQSHRIVIGTPEVPIGHYTLQILDLASQKLGSDFRTRVESKVVSRELNVRQVLAKVTLGEANAGIVYRTDAQSSKNAVSVITIPSEMNVIADYPIATMTKAVHPKLAREWVAFVLSSAGQAALQSAGFLAPVSGP
jgi:molybdate transport system substrate-binding protein